MTKGIFIVGTDTDIGKTYVTASIIKKLRENNINAGYYKGALSGAVVDGNKIICDAQYVIDKVGINGDINNYVSYIMQGGYSPHLAARLEGVDISLEKIVSDFYDLKDRFDFITVEGSGGIICPIRLDDKTIMLTDIIKKINLDIIIVASASLGTINSTVLTVEYARSCGLNIKGI
ncbi:MAG: dethiobiotin synthase, partial [Clostridium sp.]